MPVKHKKTSTIPDSGSSSKVRASDWNDDHAVSYSIATVGTNTVLNDTHELVLANGGASGITVTLPTAVGITGRAYRIKKIDAAAGAVTIATTSSQTIDDSSTYLLVAQYQFVIVVSTGANWVVVGQN